MNCFIIIIIHLTFVKSRWEGYTRKDETIPDRPIKFVETSVEKKKKKLLEFDVFYFRLKFELRRLALIQ